MKTYFVTGVADVVWGGMTAFGSENHYFQAAKEELNNPEFISMGDLEKVLKGTDGSDAKIYVDRSQQMVAPALRQKFPKAQIRYFKPKEAAADIPNIAKNPMIIIFEVMFTFMVTASGAAVGAAFSNNVYLGGFIGGIIAATVVISAFVAYRKYSTKKIKSYEADLNRTGTNLISSVKS